MKKTAFTKPTLIASAIGVALAIGACNNGKKQDATDSANTGMAFAKGDKITNDNFIGTARLNYLVSTDSIHHVNIGSVTFEPGARTNWHFHEGGQILLVTEGK